MNKPEILLPTIPEILAIRRGNELYTVEIIALADKRGPAKIAQQLYQETEESLKLREKQAEMRRIEQMSIIQPAHKPDKRQRRKIHQFKQSQGE